MKKDILSNLKNTDALENFFECITSCSINSEGVDCTTACYAKHLEPANVDYPLNFLWADSTKLRLNIFIYLKFQKLNFAAAERGVFFTLQFPI